MRLHPKQKAKRFAANYAVVYAMYTDFELFPAEYLVVHQTAATEVTERIKNEAKQRFEARAKKRAVR